MASKRPVKDDGYRQDSINNAGQAIAQGIRYKRCKGNTCLLYTSPIVLAEKDNTSAFQFVAPRIIISIIVFILVTLFGFFILGLFIKFSLTNPVESLVSSMREVKTGWLRRCLLYTST